VRIFADILLFIYLLLLTTGKAERFIIRRPLSVCLSVCQTTTFESLNWRTQFVFAHPVCPRRVAARRSPGQRHGHTSRKTSVVIVPPTRYPNPSPDLCINTTEDHVLPHATVSDEYNRPDGERTASSSGRI